MYVNISVVLDLLNPFCSMVSHVEHLQKLRLSNKYASGGNLEILFYIPRIENLALDGLRKWNLL